MDFIGAFAADESGADIQPVEKLPDVAGHMTAGGSPERTAPCIRSGGKQGPDAIQQGEQLQPVAQGIAVVDSRQGTEKLFPVGCHGVGDDRIDHLPLVQPFPLKPAGGCGDFCRQQQPVPDLRHRSSQTHILQKGKRGVKSAQAVEQGALEQETLISSNTVGAVKSCF